MLRLGERRWTIARKRIILKNIISRANEEMRS